MRGWHDKYETTGLTIVGVHSPEFPWEKPFDKVKEASGRLGIKFPVVQDNNFASGNASACGPGRQSSLIDKKGVIRYSHVGEGAYDKTESMIKLLLAE